MVSIIHYFPVNVFVLSISEYGTDKTQRFAGFDHFLTDMNKFASSFSKWLDKPWHRAGIQHIGPLWPFPTTRSIYDELKINKKRPMSLGTILFLKRLKATEFYLVLCNSLASLA